MSAIYNSRYILDIHIYNIILYFKDNTVLLLLLFKNDDDYVDNDLQNK